MYVLGMGGRCALIVGTCDMSIAGQRMVGTSRTILMVPRPLLLPMVARGASTVCNLWKGGQPEKPSEFAELLKELRTSRMAIMVTHTAVDGMELDSVTALVSTLVTRTLRRKL